MCERCDRQIVWYVRNTGAWGMLLVAYLSLMVSITGLTEKYLGAVAPLPQELDIAFWTFITCFFALCLLVVGERHEAVRIMVAITLGAVLLVVADGAANGIYHPGVGIPHDIIPFALALMVVITIRWCIRKRNKPEMMHHKPA